MAHKPFLSFVFLITLAASALAGQTPGFQVSPQTVPFDAQYMDGQISHRQPPDVAWVRHSRQDVAPVCWFRVVLGVDGKVESIQPQNACQEPYLSSAQRAVRKWSWAPQMVNGTPVKVSTQVVVNFGDPNGSPVGLVDTDQKTAVSIVLKSGSTIHADSMQQQGANVSYMIGEDSYEIPAELVEKIENNGPPAPKVPPVIDTSSSTKAASASPYYPPGFESTEQLRQECAANPAGMNRSHMSDVPYCTLINVEMGPDYERNVDTAVILEESLCKKLEGPLLSMPRPSDGRLVDGWDEFQARFNQVQKVASAAYGQANLALQNSIGTSQADLQARESRLDAKLNGLYTPMDASTREELSKELNDVRVKLGRYQNPTDKEGPAFQAARMKALRASMDISRLSVSCKGGQ
jgi:Gram-negative bacterial TonB protein C-terminal